MARTVEIYNTLTKSKHVLVPQDQNQIKIYACGVTVYDDHHIGHAMQAIFFDVIRSYLESAGYKVTYVRNYTDVDDKIINRAEKLGISPKKLANDVIAQGEVEMAQLGVRKATFEPKVSETISEIIEMISTLIEKNYAYPTQVGDVYFRVRQKLDYGKLSNRSISELRSGDREIMQGQKEDPLDFALWKADKTPDASWQSPWGQGRPGWHIECSAMAKKYLGNSFDIHGGGLDLVFPHHENEIAQSESANGCSYAAFWVHSGLLTINKQKMSKSLGNTITLKDFLSQWPAEVLRLGYLQNHYRSSIDFSTEVFKSCRRKLLYFYETIASSESIALSKTSNAQANNALIDFASCEESFHKAMCDDFNTPVALAQLQKLARLVNQHLAAAKKSDELKATIKRAALLLKELGNILGLFKEPAEKFLTDLKLSLLPELGISIVEIESALEERRLARVHKDWQKSDQIRDLLREKGIILRDELDKTVWSIANLFAET